MPAKIQLYSFLPSQNAVRPEIALREKGLRYEKIAVDLMKGEHKQPPLSDLTPRQQAPTLVHGEGDDRIVVYESIATIRFIDDIYPEPPLMPPVSEPRRRAQASMRIEEFQAKLDPKNIFGSVVFAKKGRAELGNRVDALLEELPRWDTYLGKQTFLAGDQFTLADIAVFPLLLHFEVLGYDYAKHTPQLAGYIARCKERPSIQQSGWLDDFGTFIKSRAPERILA